MNPTPFQAQSTLQAVGIQCRVDGDQFFVRTGTVSKNLLCLCLNNGAAGFARFPIDAMVYLTDAPLFHTPNGAQWFFLSAVPHATVKLTSDVTIHGDSDELPTFPTPGFTRSVSTIPSKPPNSFTRLPSLNASEYQRLVSIIQAAAVVAELPETTDANIAQVYAGMACTEDNVTMVFEDRYKAELRYCESWGKWLKWDKCRWQIENTLLAFNYCRLIARRMNLERAITPAKASFARGVEALARSSRTFATVTEDWDKNYWFLNTPTGTIDLRTGFLADHRKPDHLTKVSRISPQRGPHPVFDRFMADITLEDSALAEYLQRALGACLSGAIQDNFILFFYGSGQNGKSTLIELFISMLGDYADVVPTETLMSNKSGGGQHLTFLASLRGLRLAVSSEVEEGSFFNEARLKQLSGDEAIRANYMHCDPFTFRRTHKHVILGNHRPQIRAADPALKSRLHMIPFKAHFPPDAKDPNMAAKIAKEAPAILFWAVEGHTKWLEDGYLKPCSAVQVETESYFESQSTPEMWIQECCRENHEYEGASKDLYASFKVWKEARSEGIISQTRWAEWMSSRGYPRVRHGNSVSYQGIELRPEFERVRG